MHLFDQIIERNHEPFRPLEVDTVTLDIIESALRNARYEMDAALFRTAMSPGIREQHEEIRGVPRRENTADAHAIAGVGAAGHDRPAGEVDHLVVVLPQPQDLVGRRR